MFEKFTEKGIKVIMYAQEEARRLGHNFVGTEQLLLGLIPEGNTIAGSALKTHRVNLKTARVEVQKIIGRGSGFVAVEIPFTPRAKRVVQIAWDEARHLGHDYIGTEHLLLGLIREGEGVAARVLENMGVDLQKLKQTVLDNPKLNRGTSIPIETRGVIEPELKTNDESAAEDESAKQAETKACPNCGERIHPEAIICRFCRSGLHPNHFRPCPSCSEMIRKQAKLCRFCNSKIEWST